MCAVSQRKLLALWQVRSTSSPTSMSSFRDSYANDASVYACRRITWVCHPENNEAKFQPVLPLIFQRFRAVQQRNSSSNSDTTPLNLEIFTSPVFRSFTMRCVYTRR